jgi:hypothetical protein
MTISFSIPFSIGDDQVQQRLRLSFAAYATRLAYELRRIFGISCVTRVGVGMLGDDFEIGNPTDGQFFDRARQRVQPDRLHNWTAGRNRLIGYIRDTNTINLVTASAQMPGQPLLTYETTTGFVGVARCTLTRLVGISSGLGAE